MTEAVPPGGVDVLIVYSTTDGQTLKICRFLQAALEREGLGVALLGVDQALGADLPPCRKVVVGASIRYGRHAKGVYRFVAERAQWLEARPNAFFSVNVVARKPGKDRPETNPYLRKFLRQIPWQPRELEVFAGMIDYRRYGWLDRQMIRLIMWMTKGPTAPDACVEFTDWQRVEVFASRIAAL